MKNLLFLLGLVLVIGGCGNREAADKVVMEKDDIPVKLMRISIDSSAQVFNSTGYFTTDNETPLSFKNGGVIDKIYVKEGDVVSTGQILASVKTTEIQAMVTQAELIYEKAMQDYERTANLFQDSVATLEQMQNARTALDVAEQQRASVDYNLGESVIKARSGGYVLETFMKEGQVTGPGMPVLLMSGDTKGQWIFKTSVGDEQWALIVEGDSATIETDIDKNLLSDAIVFKKSRSIDRESGGFMVHLLVKNKEKLPLATGLFGKTKIYSGSKEAAWRLPFDAVMEGDGNRAYVFAVKQNKYAVKLPIIIDRIESGAVVVQSGLEGVEEVIISGNAYLKDGSTIVISE